MRRRSYVYANRDKSHGGTLRRLRETGSAFVLRPREAGMQALLSGWGTWKESAES